MNILGINCYLHNSSASLLQDGRLVAAVEEERFTRKKQEGRFPIEAIRWCLSAGGISSSDLDYVTFYWNPWLAIHKRIYTIIRYFPHTLPFFGTQESERADTRTWRAMVQMNKTIKKAFPWDKRNYKFRFIPHHLGHAASSFFLSPFDEAAIFSVDGTGEWTTTLLAHGRGNKIYPLKEITYPHSLGVLYGATTQFLGFRVCFDEWKVMGLSAYGKPRYYEQAKKMLFLDEGGGFHLDKSYFDFQYSDKKNWYSERFRELFGPERLPQEPIEERHADIARSVQKVLEEAALHIANFLHKATGSRNLCVAGGVALNSVMNALLLGAGEFKEFFGQPAAHDAGSGLGSALYLYHHILNKPRNFVMEDAYLGPEYSEVQMEAALRSRGLHYEKMEDIEAGCARLLAEGKILGWFQGRIEFGPRALGNRSILADPRRAEMKDILNQRVKEREAFRPFAPSVLAERTSEYFQIDYPSPFMLLVYEVRPEKREIIPAVTHTDGTGRLQTVEQRINPRFYSLIKEFEKITGVPVLLNTSFNGRGEPIVLTPKDALNCFLRTGIDCLAMGNFLVKKEKT